MTTQTKKPRLQDAVKVMMQSVIDHARNNGWDAEALARKAAGVSDQDVARTLLVYRSKFVTPVGRGLPRKVPKTCHEPFEDNIPMWAWIRTLEASGLSRGLLPCKATFSPGGSGNRQEPRPTRPTKKTKKTKKTKRLPERPGRPASELTDIENMRILKARNDSQARGEVISLHALEEMFGLRRTHGMTAARAIKAAEDFRDRNPKSATVIEMLIDGASYREIDKEISAGQGTNGKTSWKIARRLRFEQPGPRKARTNKEEEK